MAQRDRNLTLMSYTVSHECIAITVPVVDPALGGPADLSRLSADRPRFLRAGRERFVQRLRGYACRAPDLRGVRAGPGAGRPAGQAGVGKGPVGVLFPNGVGWSRGRPLPGSVPSSYRSTPSTKLGNWRIPAPRRRPVSPRREASCTTTTWIGWRRCPELADARRPTPPGGSRSCAGFSSGTRPTGPGRKAARPRRSPADAGRRRLVDGLGDDVSRATRCSSPTPRDPPPNPRASCTATAPSPPRPQPGRPVGRRRDIEDLDPDAAVLGRGFSSACCGPLGRRLLRHPGEHGSRRGPAAARAERVTNVAAWPAATKSLVEHPDFPATDLSCARAARSRTPAPRARPPDVGLRRRRSA